MHRWMVGQCHLQLRLVPKSPWMIRGQTDRRQKPHVLYPLVDPHGRPLLPASSLKGVIRSTAERILRSIDPERPLDAPPLADSPFPYVPPDDPADPDQNPVAHRRQAIQALPRSKVPDQDLPEWLNRPEYDTSMLAPAVVYRAISPISQLFGTTLHQGLVILDDATADAALEDRSHVALDRLTGGVGAGPFFDKLVDSTAVLQTTLGITNFALWHLGLLGLVFQEISRGYAGLGGGTHKGQGQVTIEVTGATVQYDARSYGNRRGIPSAQVLSALAFGGADGIPTDVLEIEQDRALLRDQVIAGPSGDWRHEGLVETALDAGQVDALFVEAVDQAWRPWVHAMRRQHE